MFFIIPFAIALSLLLALFLLKELESRRGRFFEDFRKTGDQKIELIYAWISENVTPESLVVHIKHASEVVMHYAARLVAKLSHAAERRARTVVHKTSKRVREQAHYLDGVVEKKLDSGREIR
jgi:hypothetical protein